MVKKKIEKKEGKISESELETEIEEIEKATDGNESPFIQIKASMPISKIKKGDRIKVDSLILDVDAHYVLIDHGSTKEMAIEAFDPKTDKDYQIRYFSDQVERTLDVYELQGEIIYVKRPTKKVEW